MVLTAAHGIRANHTTGNATKKCCLPTLQRARCCQVKNEKSPQLRGLKCALLLGRAGTCLTPNHSHSIINRSRKPAWLKGLGLINMGQYRRFYRQGHTSFAGAGDGALCAGATFSTPSSINLKNTKR